MPPNSLPSTSKHKPGQHDWELMGGGAGMELWRCCRCGREAFPSPFGFMWSSLARFLGPLGRRWRCP